MSSPAILSSTMYFVQGREGPLIRAVPSRPALHRRNPRHEQGPAPAGGVHDLHAPPRLLPLDVPGASDLPAYVHRELGEQHARRRPGEVGAVGRLVPHDLRPTAWVTSTGLLRGSVADQEIGALPVSRSARAT